MSTNQPQGLAPPVVAATGQQAVQAVPFGQTTTQQPQQIYMPQAHHMDPAQLLMNPHAAAMVASVAAAAAHQMVAGAPATQVVQPSPAPRQQAPKVVQQRAMAPAPHAVAIPSHLAALLGMVPQPAFQQVQTAPAPLPGMLANMQNWKLNQLESHVRMLRESNQAIPQPVAMLLADARRKEEKRTAKRVANRKSACTSRARKKALVEEMTRTNARLKRQALILALLPDLVVAITVEGEITFCSAQVERVLRYKVDDLVGANMADLLVPASQGALKTLVSELVAAELAAANASAPNDAAPANAQNEAKGDNGNDNGNANNGGSNGNGSGQSSAYSSNGPGAAAVVSDQSFPLEVVKVQPSPEGAEDNSDFSNSNGKATPRSGESGNNNSAPDSANSSLEGAEAAGTKPAAKEKATTSSDDSFSSSSDAKNLRKANENLDRNVRWHKERSKSKRNGSHKDDVIGEDVTANNAGARLSSLQHLPAAKKADLEENSTGSSDWGLGGVEEKKKAPPAKNGGSSSDESGYRESNESAREDTSSSASDMTDGNGRHKPIAPTCNVCLIRDDLTTIWCEVTSSIRTRSLKDEAADEIPPAAVMATTKSPSPKTIEELPAVEGKDEIKELLLCLRPIRDGEQKVDPSLRFVPVPKEATSGSSCDDEVSEETKKGPVKKRPVQPKEDDTAKVTNSSSNSSSQDEPPAKKSRTESEERSVVESLIMMRDPKLS